MSTPAEERLYVGKRKGFIKLAMRTGSEVIPCYYFGNTTVLEVRWMACGILGALLLFRQFHGLGDGIYGVWEFRRGAVGGVPNSPLPPPPPPSPNPFTICM